MLKCEGPTATRRDYNVWKRERLSMTWRDYNVELEGDYNLEMRRPRHDMEGL